MNALIVAKYREDIGWLDGIPDGFEVCVGNKGDEIHEARNMLNIGREANTYLDFIVKCYRRLRGDLVLCQGNPFDHDKDFIAHLGDESVRWYGPISGCPSSGEPHMDDAYLDEHCRVLGLPILGDYKFVAGAQYRLTAGQIHSRPLEFYKALLALTFINPRAPYVLERLWPSIWGIELP